VSGCAAARSSARPLDRLKAIGVDRIRVTVLWRLVAPEPASQAKPAGFDRPKAYPGGTWNRFDASCAWPPRGHRGALQPDRSGTLLGCACPGAVRRAARLP